MARTLLIGNRNYSSWSLRAWLHLKESGAEFEVERIVMFEGDWRARLRGLGAPGRVPVLVDDGFAIWDSLAILEHVRETVPGAVGWPAEPRARVRARSIAAEMHAGFLAIRSELPQNLRLRERVELSDAVARQVGRVSDLWRSCRAEFGAGGPWLFGDFSIADVMYAPVALRFVTYGVPLGPVEAAWVEAVQGLGSVREWVELARAETETIDLVERRRPLPDPP